ncbi:hypothetical protein [Alloactinosynnema sp. L-07]|uniref:hypothetical protein n=1 Tax=Alloactinosynnema sp. L-07 TaxID=1653480 RepID=UPI0012FBCF5E|nr:hypothetical protein [Alloactinosynnema sp. L-07]
MTNTNRPPAGAIEPVVFSHPTAEQPADRELTDSVGTAQSRQISFSEPATAPRG